MSLSTLKLGGREYVVVPRRQYERLTAREQDRRDAARARKAMAQFRAGKLKTISHEQVKRRLGPANETPALRRASGRRCYLRRG
jgi:hypothetical protein